MEIGGMGGQAAAQAQQMNKDMFDAQVVTGTINNLNSQPDGKMNADHAFQTSVLQADAIGKGAKLNIMA